MNSYKLIIRKLLFLLIIMLFPAALEAQRSLQGKVTDENTGEPLIGATVQIKGTSFGTITDVNGNYTMVSDLLTDASVLIFSYVGYASREEALGSRTLIDITLSLDEFMLDELVVIGYGTAKRRNVLGAVTMVGNEELSRLPVPDVSQAMQGRAAGVLVTQNTGAPGEGVSVRIRGTGSINSGNEPLYIVDGFPATNALNILSPGDIASISVLKDASAAAIYGSRANNGVVLITTKKGISGKTVISYRGQSGFQKAVQLTPMVNTTDYITIYNEAASNDNSFLPAGLQRSLISPIDAENFANVNYVDELLQVAPVNTHEFSVSGGSESTLYLFSASYFDQQGIISATGYSKGTARVDVSTSVNRWLTAGLNMMAGISDNDIIGSSGDGFGGNGGSVVRYAFFRNPAIPIRFEDGTFVDRPAEFFGRQIYDSFLGDGYNPIGMSAYNNNNHKNDIYLGSISLEAKITESLRFTANAGMDYQNSFQRRFNRTWGTLNRINARNSLNIGNLRTTNWTVNNLLNYSKVLGELHNFDALLGFEAIRNAGKGLFLNDSDFPIQEDELIFIGNGIGIQVSSQNEFASTLASFFTRLNYNYNQKYYLSATLRRDGSSRFINENKWGTFYSLSAGWMLSEEGFLEDTEWLQTLKLRAGYGAIGNQDAGLYAYSGEIAQNFNYPFGGESNSGYAQTSLGNDDLRWETSTQYNLGVDLELWRGSLAFSVDGFYKVTKDMLVKAPNPPSVGYAESAWINSGSVLNTGLELEGVYRKYETNWSFSFGTNLTFLHNEILELDAPLFGARVETGIFASRTEVGHPISSFYLLEMDGIFQNQTEILLSAFQGNDIRPGDVKFKDQDGNNRIDNNDRVHLGSALPKMIAGFNITSSYRNFDLSVFLQGTYGNKIYMQINQDIEGFYRGFPVTQRYFDERWTGEGSSSTQPRPSWTSKSNNARPSSRFLEDGSYLRLKNIQLGYKLPSGFTQFAKISEARFYLSGNNLLTLTRFPGLDPEMTVSDNSRTEGDRAAGIDWGTYPSAMSLMLGLDIKF
jgi:TonB-dependent starch-binding outer membrane protein SusC